jgi:IS30 family transposase
MSRHYKHLSKEERDRLAILKGQGLSIRTIATQLDRSPSTVSRELRRNTDSSRSEGYFPHQAQDGADVRWKQSHCRPRLKFSFLRWYVRTNIRRGWSPEQIAGRLRREGHFASVSHEAIYQWIYLEARELIPMLAKAHRKRLPRRYCKKSRFRISNRVFIQDRPEHVNTREQPGHWEVDTVQSPQGTASLAVGVERKTRYVRIKNLPRKTAVTFRRALVDTLARYPVHMRMTITYDNGSENTCHTWVNRALGTESYFCEPYHSWEKATVENSIGLIRRYFPKGTNFCNVTKKQVIWVEKQLNNRPRKCLNYQTPAEAFRQERCT